MCINVFISSPFLLWAGHGNGYWLSAPGRLLDFVEARIHMKTLIAPFFLAIATLSPKAGICDDIPIISPIFVGQQDTNIIVTDVNPFYFGVVQLVGHKYKPAGEQFVSGVNLKLGAATSNSDDSLVSLLDDTLLLGRNITRERGLSVVTSSVTDAKKIKIGDFSLLPNPSLKSEQSFEFKTFEPAHAIFLGDILVFQGQDGLNFGLNIMGKGMSPESGIFVGGRELSHDGLQIAGIDRLDKINDELMLITTNLHSAEENIFKQKKALLLLTSAGTVQRSLDFDSSTFDVFTSEKNIALATMNGEPGNFQLQLRYLDQSFKQIRSSILPIYEAFPAQFKFVESGDRPLLAVLGVTSVDLFDATSGKKSFSFKSEYEITDLISLLSIQDKLLLFVMLRDHSDKTSKCAYFELPTF